MHTQDASYLDAIHETPDEWNPTDYAYHLTRRARGLAIWFSLATHGIAAYREAIETALSMARSTAEKIEAHPRLELILEPDLSIVMFRRVGWLQADYDAWSRELLSDGIGFVLPSRWMGEPMLRFAFLHPETTPEIVEEILATLG